MKRRSRNAPLPPMRLSVAGDQPLAQQNLHPLLRALLDKALRLHDENLANELRLIHQHNIAPPHAIMRHLPVCLRQVLKEKNGIADTKETSRQIQRQIQLQPRRKAIATALFNNPVGIIIHRRRSLWVPLLFEMPVWEVAPY